MVIGTGMGGLEDVDGGKRTFGDPSGSDAGDRGREYKSVTRRDGIGG